MLFHGRLFLNYLEEGSPEHKLFEAMQPVEDPMIATEAPPKVESVPPSTLHHRQPSTTSLVNLLLIIMILDL